jgi:transposase InsO family protein
LPQHQSSQNWKTFIANHTDEVWACDFVQTYDLFFRTIFIFFIIEIGSRRIVHCNVTHNPSDKWVSQQLREATPYDSSLRFLIRDNDKKYGQHFSKVAQGAQIEMLRTPIQAPKANAYCERFIGSVRRELLDHIFILN